MAGEFTKSATLIPVIAGTLAKAQIMNQNLALIAKDSFIPVNDDGTPTDGDLGDETIGVDGTLIADLKVRDGKSLKMYDAGGNFINSALWANVLASSAFFNKYNIYGFVPSSGADPNEEINITAGEARCEDGFTIVETTGVTDLNLATELGGALAVDTTYHVYRYQRAADQAWHVEDSLTPTIGDIKSALAYRLIMSYKTDGSGDLIAHKGYAKDGVGVQIKYDARITDYNTMTSSYVTKTFTIPSGIPKYPMWLFEHILDTSGGILYAKPNAVETVISDSASSASVITLNDYRNDISILTDNMEMKDTDNQGSVGYTYGYVLYRNQY